jgi:hypothetical protein
LGYGAFGVFFFSFFFFCSFFLFGREIFSGVGVLNVVPACLRLFIVFPYFIVSLMPDMRVSTGFFKTRTPQQCPSSPSDLVASFLSRVGCRCMERASTRQGGFSPWATRASHAPLSRSRMVSTGWLLVVDWLLGASDGGTPCNDGSDLIFLFFFGFVCDFFNFHHILPL